MYARPLVEARIELAERDLGFKLEYHTPSEIDDFEIRLEERHVDAYTAAKRAAQGSKNDGSLRYQLSLIKSLANPEDPKLSSDEIRWIKNERALCMCDAEYFLVSYYWIKTQTKIIRFAFRAGQRIYYNVIQKLHLQGAPIEIIMAKARQLGISTVTEGLILQSVNYGYGVNAVIASADPNKTGKMAQMTLLGYDYLPWWNKIPYTRKVESQNGMLELKSTRSAISFQHGSQTSGIARGDTVLKYHLSEVASYTNAKDQIEAALWRCVHPDPDVLGVLESTAEGDEGWFYENYWDSKTKRSEGLPSRLFPLFLPFTVAPDQYPNPTWIRVNPIPEGWEPNDDTRAMMERAKAYIHTNDVLESVLGSKWECSRETAWYWQSHWLESLSKGTEKLWLQEMPVDDKEAFQSSYESVFGREVIAEVEATRETAYHAYAIIGQSIEECYEPDEDEIDLSQNMVEVKFVNRLRDIAYKWELQPLIWQEPHNAIDKIRSYHDEHMGKLFVYNEPEPGYDYSIGIRTGNGIGAGNTVVAVARRGRDPQDPDIQAAEFRSADVSHVEAYAWGLAIAAYYAKFMGKSGVTKTQPYVAIEQVQSVGDTCQLQMRKMGFRRFHRMTRYDSQPKDMKKSKSHKVGWFSFNWATPMYTDSFVIWVKHNWYKVNSLYTIWEMDKWERHETASGKEKYIHSEESTDDGLLANAMAAFCVNDMKPMAERTLKRNYEGRGAKPKLDINPTRIGTVFPISSYNPGIDERRIFSGSRYQ